MDPLSSPDANPAAAPAVPAARPKRRYFSPDRIAVLMIILLVLLPCAIIGIMRYSSPTSSPKPGPTGLRLNSISMISPEEGWIAGAKPRSHPDKDAFGNVDQNAFAPLILHYKGGHWTEEQLPSNINPNNLDMTLSSIAMISPTEGWATGSTLLPSYPPTTVGGVTRVTIIDGITLPVLLHYTGGVWTVVDNPSVALGAIKISQPKNGWAIGRTRAPDTFGPLALHYDGTTWNKIKDPAFASLGLQTLAVAPNGEVWMTAADYSQPAYNGDEPLLMLHYDGKTWARQPVSLANDRLFGLTMVSATEGWGVGMDPGRTFSHRRGPLQGIIVHYQQGAWQVEQTIASPAGEDYFYLSAVAMMSAGEGWAVGQDGVMVHYSNGVWKQAQSPTSENLSSVAFVSATEGWAIGDQGTILHYQGGIWSLYQR